MTYEMGFERRVVALALATGVASMLVCTEVAAQARAAARSERLVGTVTAVDHRAPSFDLLTGVGHALRVRRIHLPGKLGVRMHGAEAALPALTPGSIVRVECVSTATRTEASSVERIEPPRSSRAP